ncbi:LppU/SCO3897 family protein [Geodermatophilus ruber]|uniref:Uncharacterized protein n=1 Tax=Geodermatophilus ruber TaxID=504800 RepID=A0A1I4HC68_9ACTN|nr:hypothetical protein [Geodermatophilus ruber]SFL39187.1 hypothetical protein SAMN04488085_110110 [Geodermatophilus ruber]
MTHPTPGSDPSGLPADPSQPAPTPGAWPPPQPGAWPPPQQGAWAPQPAGAPAEGAPAPKRAKKWLRVAVPVVVAGVVGTGVLGNALGLGDPEVGDCVQMQGTTDFEVVDCGSAEAEYRIVGIEDEEQTYPDFMADVDTCADFPATEAALWIGGMETEPGTVFCAEPH